MVMFLRPPPESIGSSVPLKRPEILPVFGYVQHAQKYGNRNNEQLHPRVGWYCGFIFVCSRLWNNTVALMSSRICQLV